MPAAFPSPESAPARKAVGLARHALIRVAVVDEDPLTRDGIRAILAAERDLCLIDEAPDLPGAVMRLPMARPDVVFVEAGLAAEHQGAGVRALVRSLSGVQILVFGQGRREEEIFHALDAGASGYVLRSTIKTELVTATRWAQAGRRYLPLEIQRRLADRQRRPQLTPREKAVLELLAHARSNATIAAVLGISIGTVKLHVKAILAKLGVEDRAEAALVAMERGFSRLT